MSKLPYMKLWVGDLLADTDDLSPTEFGIYLRLITHAWKNKGRVPLDKIALCNITRCERRFWHRFGQSLIDRYFVSPDAPELKEKLAELGVPVEASTGTQICYSVRVVTELLSSARKSSKNKAAAEKMHSERIAKNVLSHSHSHKERKEDAPPAAAPAAAEAAPAATPFLTSPEGGAAPAAPAAKIYAFEQGRVRFTYADYQDLVDSFKHIDVHGALRALAGLCIDKKDWHGFILNALAKRNQVAKERIEIEKSRLESKPKQTWID